MASSRTTRASEESSAAEKEWGSKRKLETEDSERSTEKSPARLEVAVHKA